MLCCEDTHLCFQNLFLEDRKKGPTNRVPLDIYRPTFVLPVVSKALEKHVATFIQDHLLNNAPISDYPCHTGPHAVSALILVVSEWLNALDGDSYVLYFLMCSLKGMHLWTNLG